MFGISARRRRLFVASLIWALWIFIVSIQPHKFAEVVLPEEFLFAVAHLIAYGVLTFLLCLYFRFKRVFLKIRIGAEWKGIGLAFLASVLWGSLNELAQVVSPDRIASWVDWGWNVVGAVCGILFFLWFKYSLKDWGGESRRKVTE